MPKLNRMKRIEIIANQSVQEEILGGIETAIPDILYTMIPVVHGKGSDDRKLGTSTWPETNFLLISYVSPSDEEKIMQEIENVRKRFPTEGIATFSISC